MNFSVVLLILLILLCIAEIIIGIVKKTRFLVIIGSVFAVVLILALLLALQYADALYISDPGHIL